jgi:leucyl/phenylalanyl-tRNA--protein transferase
MKYLSQNTPFPEVSEASPEGLLAIGGGLSTSRLIEAYEKGIFPWFGDEEPILWWSPDPRFVLFPDKLKVSKSMRQVLRNKDFAVTLNRDFEAVIAECAKAERKGQDSTWITIGIQDAYVNLHKLGYAKSVEVWRDDELVGGLYGVDLNNGVFCGESMFAKEANASKVAFISFVQKTNYKLIDCQVHTNHLESLGAEKISRELFLRYLKN